jgi:hypothetical protein
MRHLATPLAIAAILLLAPYAGAANAPSLDGRTFLVDLTMPDGKAEKDTLVFNAGTGDSLACHQYGFGGGKATYAGAEPVTFAFTATSAKEGAMEWTGSVTGGHVVGTAVWTKEGKAQTLRFAGDEAKPGDVPPIEKK